jgi:cobalt-precorrin 5A hydrolase/precorrin-3B C17-methyltransferase
VPADEVLRLVDSALGEGGLSAASVLSVAMAEGEPGESGIAGAARERDWPLVTYPASRLAGHLTQPRSRVALARVATQSVSEAAALVEADDLVVPERTSEGVSVAVARVRPRGRLALVGTGPGPRDLLTPRAVSELRRASVVAGVGPALEQVGDLLRVGTRILDSPPGGEDACGREAVRQARLGHAVAIAFPADPARHALAGLVADLAGDDVEVVRVPGVQADPG